MRVKEAAPNEVNINNETQFDRMHIIFLTNFVPTDKHLIIRRARLKTRSVNSKSVKKLKKGKKWENFIGCISNCNFAQLCPQLKRSSRRSSTIRDERLRTVRLDKRNPARVDARFGAHSEPQRKDGFVRQCHRHLAVHIGSVDCR